jgi:hypothetical protein
MSENAAPKPEMPKGLSALFSQDRLRQRILVVFVVAIAIFLSGFLPAWFKGRAYASQLRAAQSDLHLDQIQLALASAAIDARRGDYEPARGAAASFFTLLSAGVEPPRDRPFSAQQRESLAQLLKQRDSVITLLARSDPASAERLSEIFVACRKALAR